MAEIKRKLATIERITALSPIDGADSIEVADVRGWRVVVKKGDFDVGELCVYCEIDSVLPERPEFEFLAKNNYRIRTIKLRGQVSQGIIFPIDILHHNGWGPGWIHLHGDGSPIEYSIKKDTELLENSIKLTVGLDVTDIIGVTKYEYPIPACLDGEVLGGFPSHSIKTDEERIQNLKERWDSGELHQYQYFETEKLDGSSCTCFIYEDRFGIASRKLELAETKDNSFWKVARELEVEGKMRDYMSYHGIEAMTLQGELIGEGIQGNKYKLKGQDLRFFQSFFPVSYKYPPYDVFLKSMLDMGLNTVPISNRDFTLPKKFEDLLSYVEGSSLLADTQREGSVFVAANYPQDMQQGRMSFKVISNKFILKHKE